MCFAKSDCGELGVAQIRAAPDDVGISGLGPKPTNPWCQHPRRPPPKIKSGPERGNTGEPVLRIRTARSRYFLGQFVGESVSPVPRAVVRSFGDTRRDDFPFSLSHTSV